MLAYDGSAQRFDDDDVIELTYAPIQVSLFGRETGLTMPYWFEGAEAEAMTAKLFGFAQVLIDEGYVVYDPQSDEVLQDGAGGADAARIVSGTKAKLDELVAGDARPPRWQFWRR